MAYLTKEKTRDFRAQIKTALSEYKLSIINMHYSMLKVSITNGKQELGEYKQLNHFYPDNYSPEINRILKIINNIVFDKSSGFHDESDCQSDYFNTSWYLRVDIGKWDKPYLNNL